MKNQLLVTALLLYSTSLFAQNTEQLFIDNNPKVTDAEAKWLNENFGSDSFDFSGKYIEFIQLEPAYAGIGRLSLPIRKKDLQQLPIQLISYRLLILDSAEKKMTRGYDAVFVFTSKQFKRKLRRIKRDKLLSTSKNRYPQIPTDAGKDTNALLSDANAVFFNELYKAQLYPDTSFDFRGKKVAIFDTHCQFGELERISIPEYIKHIKSFMDQWGFSMADSKYLLNEEQKEETGGYDVIIKYSCKMDLPVNSCVEYLKRNKS